MHKNCYSFDGKIYKQISGVFMGSFLWSVLANMMRQNLRDYVSKRIQDGFTFFWMITWSSYISLISKLMVLRQ